MNAVAYAWAPITKAEDQDDGTLLVYGAASDTTVDRDQQRMNQEWLDKAMPQWMAEGGNIREQHDAKRAVGVGVGLHKDESSGAWMLTSRVVDPVAVLKVKHGVLKGYSIGIKEPHVTFGKAEAPNGEIDGGTIVETSLADRPSNPTSYFTLAKADAAGELVAVEAPEFVEEAESEALKFVSASSRRRMASQGVAMPSGDFPIPDEGHLRSAIGHLGDYTGDKAAAKAHIISRARALGLTSKLPDDWGVAPSDNAEKVEQTRVWAAGLVPELTKAEDESGDIAGAQQAIALIAKLIQNEAASLAGGQLDEDDDIKCLLDAVCALKYFICREEQEMEPNPNPDQMSANVADSTAIAGSAYEMKADTVVETPEVTKVENPSMADIVKAAIAEATTPLRDELALVKADLAKVKAMPEPGGPVAMRTASQAVAARGADAASLRAQAADLLAKADAVRREDPTLALGYRDRANDLLSKADA